MGTPHNSSSPQELKARNAHCSGEASAWGGGAAVNRLRVANVQSLLCYHCRSK
jgi:hypothetical protein